MKERPILFSAPMVRAILDGRKTQTRRVVKPQPRDRADIGTAGRGLPFIRNQKPLGNNIWCPYGQPGDQLWVREACLASNVGFDRYVAYRADGEPDPTWLRPVKWRPSIHMPRWASRITLEVTGVRVEHLHQISSDDAFAEGIDTEGDVYCEGESLQSAGSPVSPERYAFATLWRSINGDASWDANPWVWVVEIRRVEPTGMPTMETP